MSGASFTPALRARFLALGSPYRRRRWLRALKGFVWFLVICSAAIVITAVSVLAASPPEGAKLVTTTQLVLAACLSSLASGLIGTVATVISLEVLRSRRLERQERDTFISRLRSTNAEIVAEAVEDLRSRGLLVNGYLDQADLRGTALQQLNLRSLRAVGAQFDGSDLTATMLYEADLRYSLLRDVKVTGATNLHMCKADGADFAGVDRALLASCGLRVP